MISDNQFLRLVNAVFVTGCGFLALTVGISFRQTMLALAGAVSVSIAVGYVFSGTSPVRRFYTAVRVNFLLRYTVLLATTYVTFGSVVIGSTVFHWSPTWSSLVVLIGAVSMLAVIMPSESSAFRRPRFALIRARLASMPVSLSWPYTSAR